MSATGSTPPFATPSDSQPITAGSFVQSAGADQAQRLALAALVALASARGV